MNIKELAQILQLSKSTVSRAFQDRDDINPETRAKILAKAKELNYVPNVYASNLRERKSNTIAVVIPELANNFFSQAVKGIERICQMHNYHVLVYSTDSNYDKEKEIIDNLLNGRVDGIIMSVTGEGKKLGHIKEIVKRKIPLVFFDRIYNEFAVPKVITNDYDASYQATQDLIQRGCQKIAFFVVDKEESIGHIRMQGYLDALNANGFEAENKWVLDCDNDRSISFHIIKSFLEKEKPDAIVTAVERLAMVTYRVCLQNKIVIPDQLKIIGFSCLAIADLLNPALSVIEQPSFDMGIKSAQLLFAQMKTADFAMNEPMMLESKIIHRESTKC